MPNAKLKCVQCGERKPREDMDKINAISSICKDIECKVTYATKKGKKAVKDKAKKDDALRKQVFNISDTKKQLALTQTVFNKMRRLQELHWFKSRGIKPYCISCQKTNMDWCCGHFKTVGSQSNLRFDEKNTYLQCNRYCNMAKSGNIEGCKNTIGYKKGLVSRFGEEGRKTIEYCETHMETKKWDSLELIEMRKRFNIIIRELESDL